MTDTSSTATEMEMSVNASSDAVKAGQVTTGQDEPEVHNFGLLLTTTQSFRRDFQCSPQLNIHTP